MSINKSGVYVPLHPDVGPDHPDVARLMNELMAVKPLPPKLTVREQLARSMHSAYEKAAIPGDIPSTWEQLSSHFRSAYLAEADAAIEFFLKVARDVQLNLQSDGRTNIGVMHDDNVEDFVDNLKGALSK